MRFKNIVTGNTLSTDNKAVIELMKKSENYEALPDIKQKNNGKKSDENI